MSECWLLIETSGRAGKLGVARGGAVTRTAALDETRRHARDLALTADRLLTAEGVAPRDLAGVMVSVGPGGYTGLRVGVMSAKALAYATGCRLVAVPTFAAIAEQAPAEAEELTVVADALQGMIYIQSFHRSETGWAATDDLRIDRADAWLPRTPDDVWLSGPGVRVYPNLIPQAAKLVSEADRDPRMESVWLAGRRQPPVAREELFRLEPLYLRGSSAEEKAKQKG